MDYKRLNTIVGWMIFIFASIVYLTTIEPTSSLWDCGEYITTAYKLEVGHPPGAPLFMMLGRVFTIFAEPENAAMMVNAMSGLCSSFTILFLFWTITMIAKKVVLAPAFNLFSSSSSEELEEIDQDEKKREKKSLTEGQKWAVLGSGLIGAIAYTFTDSFWFSAVEGEVYAMSSFFTAIVVWALFKWDNEVASQEDMNEVELNEEKNPNRWIVFMFFMIGLSIGVHLLNLLCIPAIAYVIYFRKVKETTKLGFVLTGIIGVGTLGIIQAIIIPKTVQLAGWFERSFVNVLGMPFNSGTIFFFMFMTGVVIAGLYFSKKYIKPILNTIVWSISMIFIGYSCFAMIVIRSNANTPLDENDPENLVSLESYLKREQYGDWPILYGQYFNSEMNDRSEWADRSDVYLRRYVVINKKGVDLKGFKLKEDADAYASQVGGNVEEKYFLSFDGKNGKPSYVDEECTVFPRMYSSEGRHVSGYKSWTGHKGNRLPTMGENLSYFSSYQVNWMYWRYFMWNFSGKQNDEQGHGDARNGNWISGLNFIDKHHIGDQTNAPALIVDNPSHNEFFMLPFILGLIGFIFMLMKATKSWWVIMLLFLLTGLAIIIYLNQKPMEPRERDYAYAASFYAFSMWIGLSVLALYDAFKSWTFKDLGIVTSFLIGLGLIFAATDATASISMMYIGTVIAATMGLMIFLRSVLKKELHASIIAIAITLPVPILMGIQGWDDHDRSDRYFARDLAEGYLTSCDKNAIVFTSGDNDTFPLWYLQEVEEIKTDVRVCNLSLLNTDWYTEQMTKQAYESTPLPISFTEEQYRQNGDRDYLYVVSTNELTMGASAISPKWKTILDKKIESNPDLFSTAFKVAGQSLYNILATTSFGEKKPELLASLPQFDSTGNYYSFRNLVINLIQEENMKEFAFTNEQASAIQNVMLVFNDSFDYLPGDYAMAYLGNDANIENRNGQTFFILPCKGLSVDVNKENVMKNGIVSEENEDRIVDVIKWQIPSSTIMKADLMILDIVSHFDWERPIYFGGMAERKAYVGLHKYFFSEGLVYKLVPIEAISNRNPNSLGEVNKATTYDNLMNKFSYGNLKQDGVLADYTIRRYTNNYRVLFSVLVDAYLEDMEKSEQKLAMFEQILGGEGDPETPINTPLGTFTKADMPGEIEKANEIIAECKTKVLALLDYSIAVMPQSQVPFGRVFPSYISAYFAVGAQDKGRQYADIMMQLYEEELNYYLEIDPEFSSRMIDDMYASYRGVFSISQACANFCEDAEYKTAINTSLFTITENVMAGLDEMRRGRPEVGQHIDQTFTNFLRAYGLIQ